MPQLTPPKKPQFPPTPEFATGDIGPRVSDPATQNWGDWSQQYQNSVPPTKSVLEMFMDVMDDPRNAWLGLGPMAGAIKGARLIKPLVEAERSTLGALRPATQKSLKWSGSEQAAKILDYDPNLGHTTNPVWGSAGQTAESFATPPATPDEIVAAQNILKQLAQQNAPATTTLYRGGEPLRHAASMSGKGVPNPNTPVPATSNLNIATEFAARNAPLFELQVPRADLLANIEKLQRGRGYRESEYLIPLRAFQGAQLRLPFENPFPGSNTQYQGAKFNPYYPR